MIYGRLFGCNFLRLHRHAKPTHNRENEAINNEKIHPNRFYLDLGVSDSESLRPGEGATPLYDYTLAIRQLSRT
jgi:hypothetical protein